MLSRISSQVPLWRRALRRRRRTLAALAAALLLAVLAPSVLPAILPGASPTTTVVVAASDLPAGTTLEADDLSSVRVAEDLAPPRSLDGPEQLRGHRTVVAVPAGTPLLPGMLEGETTAAVPEGHALMAISAPAVLAPHLAPGATIEVLSSTPQEGRTRSTRAQVVEVSPDEDGGGAAIGGGASNETVVLISVDPAGARELAHAHHEGWLMISVIG